jgi:integrase
MPYKYLIFILQNGGFRVSEVLAIKWSDITSDGRVLVRGLKGSSDRFFFDSFTKSFLLLARASKVDPFAGMNRFQVYRYCKLHGYMVQKEGRVNVSVTHSFRENYVREMKELTEEKEVLKVALGHKSINSQNFYGTAKKKSIRD